MSTPLYKCWTKATTRETGVPRRSYNWAFARRAWFKVFSDKIECGDWNIPFSEIQQAGVYRGKQMFMPIQILEIQTSGGTYQFGFNPWADPIKHLAIPYREERVKLKYSALSIAARVILVCYLIYLIWKRLG
jgi:hypothetical protein